MGKQKAENNTGYDVKGHNAPDSVSTAEVRKKVGELYYRQFSILLALTAVYYVFITVRDFVSPADHMAWVLYASNLLTLGFLLATYLLEKRGIIHQGNVYLVPIPISFSMLLNVHVHVMVFDDVNTLLRGIVIIVAFGIVALLPWIFWLLVLTASSFYLISAYVLLGDQSGQFIVLGIAATMVSYAGFIVRHNSVREQIRLMLLNKQRAEEMEQLARAKDEFVANMSHELRTPLTGLMGMVDLLEEAPLRAQDRHHLMTARSSAETLRVVIDDILDLSKLGAGMLKLVKAPFDLGQLASEVTEMMNASAINKRLVVALKLPAGDIPMVTGDQARLRQVLFNLVGNAVKFTEEGQVVLSVIVKGQTAESLRVRIEVEDTGIGIAAEDQERLFARFEQIDSSATRGHAGTGLGLAISQELVQLMGGQISLESAPGKGSTFWFDIELPTTVHDVHEKTSFQPSPDRQSDAVTGQTLTSAGDKGQAQLRVLIAEDNPVNQMLITKLAEKKAWQTHVVADGLAAIAAADQQPFDIILMDIQMPRMTGDEAARKIRASSTFNKNTPIIALTANCLADDVARYREKGMNDVIAKPIKLESFYQSVAEHTVK